MPTDVSKLSQLENLAQKTLDAFGRVHLLFNNAGVGIPKLTWEYNQKDWEWVLGVNLWGVIHGIQTFVPIMLKQDIECHIINTSSIEGLFSGGVGGAVYAVTKHGLMTLSETLKLDLDRINSKINVSVICPGFILTKIFTSWMRRPEEFKEGSDKPTTDIDVSKGVDQYRESLQESPPINTQEAADIIFQGIQNNDFYILTHKQSIMKDLVKQRMESIIEAFDK